MPAITAAYLSLQTIALAQSQTAPADRPQMSYRLNRDEGTVSLIMRDGSLYDYMALLSFRSELDASRPYSFKPSDGVFYAVCYLEQDGSLGLGASVGSLGHDGKPIGDVLMVNCWLQKKNKISMRVISGSVRPDSNFCDGFTSCVDGTVTLSRGGESGDPPEGLDSLLSDDRVNDNVMDSVPVRLIRLDRAINNLDREMLCDDGVGGEVVLRVRPTIPAVSRGLPSSSVSRVRNARVNADAVARRVVAPARPTAPEASGGAPPSSVPRVRDARVNAEAVASRAIAPVRPIAPEASGGAPPSSMPHVRDERVKVKLWRRVVGLVRPGRRAANGDLQSSSLSQARLRHDYLSGRFVR